jgi:type I restriction enzyme M protein
MWQLFAEETDAIINLNERWLHKIKRRILMSQIALLLPPSRNDGLADLDNLPDPDVLAEEIAENLESALGSFRGLKWDGTSCS